MTCPGGSRPGGNGHGARGEDEAGEAAGQPERVDDLGRSRTGPGTISPEGSCSCGRDLADAADLGVARSFQQREIPAAPAERVQHDLHEARCACGRAHLAARPPGVPDSALSIGPRLRALTVYLVVFQHVPVERCQQLIADVTGAAVSEGIVHSCLATGKNAMDVLHNLMPGRPWRPPAQAFSP
jgi:hypothetical protein